MKRLEQSHASEIARADYSHYKALHESRWPESSKSRVHKAAAYAASLLGANRLTQLSISSGVRKSAIVTNFLRTGVRIDAALETARLHLDQQYEGYIESARSDMADYFAHKLDAEVPEGRQLKLPVDEPWREYVIPNDWEVYQEEQRLTATK